MTIPKYGAVVTTVDPATSLIEVALKTGETRQIGSYATPVAWRWPKVGDQVMVRQENGSWLLDGWFLEDGVTTIQDAQPGDAIISSPTGTLRVVGTPNGAGDFSITKENIGVMKSGSGTFVGTGAATRTVIVTHGLGMVPGFYGATPLFEGVVKGLGVSETTFTVQFDIFAAAGSPGSSVTFGNFGTSSWGFRWFVCL